MRQFYIVTFAAEEADDCALQRCPMNLIGPFRSKEDAMEYTDTHLPMWTEPHYFEPTPVVGYSDDGRIRSIDLRSMGPGKVQFSWEE